MTDLSFSLPSDLARRVETRIADGEFADAGDYLRELVQRDLAEADEETTWQREQIEIGRASGVIDKDAMEVVREIIAELDAEDG